MRKKNDKETILFVVNDAWFFESHRLPIAKELVKQGKEVHLAALTDQSCERIKKEGIRHHHWNITPRSRNPIKEIIAAISLIKIILKVNPELLHLVTIKAVLYGGFISRLLRIKSVVFAISGLGYLYRNSENKKSILSSLSLMLYKYSLNHPNSAVIVQNMEDKKFFNEQLKIEQSSIFQLPGSGVDVSRFVPIKRDARKKLRIVLAARMLWDKGVGVFSEAAHMMNQTDIHAEFVLVGHTDEANPRSVSKNQLNDWEKSGILQWEGHRDDMVQVLQEADIFCLPTMYGEGLPKVLIEAAACSCAIIASDWPGCRDIIDHDTNGILVAPGDALALSCAIEKLCNSETLRKELGMNARLTAAEDYSIELVVAQTVSIYRNLLGH